MVYFKQFVLVLIRGYQKILSPDRGYLRFIIPLKRTCTMYPSCSQYAYDAVRKYGVYKGLYMGFFRILRCHPYQKKLVDEP